jgi:uncharacterized protein YdbL (DUF1318 family)
MTISASGLAALSGLALLILQADSRGAAVPAKEEPAKEEKAVSFNIPPSELAHAIKAFQDQSGATFPILRGEHIFGRHTAGVTGTMPPREALGRLLQGTGLVFTQDERGRYYLAKPVSFDIPPGDLFERIRLIADQGGEYVSYGPETLGKRTEGVTGTMATRDALERLLKGTGLDFLDQGDRFVVPAPTRPPPPPPKPKAMVRRDSKALDYAIPAGFLRDQLRTFQRLTGGEVHFPEGGYLDRQAQGLRGRFAPAQVLDQLLSDTDMTFVEDGSGAYFIERVSNVRVPGGPCVRDEASPLFCHERPPKAVSFDIPPGDLIRALVKFREQARASAVTWNEDLTSAMRTEGVRESLPPLEALRRLLNGTKLSPVQRGDSYCVFPPGKSWICETPERRVERPSWNRFDDSKYFAGRGAGEQADGYVGIIDSMGSPLQLEADAVNARRRARYADSARHRGVASDVVAAEQACAILARLYPGDSYRFPDGIWRYRDGQGIWRNVRDGTPAPRPDHCN